MPAAKYAISGFIPWHKRNKLRTQARNALRGSAKYAKLLGLAVGLVRNVGCTMALRLVASRRPVS